MYHPCVTENLRLSLSSVICALSKGNYFQTNLQHRDGNVISRFAQGKTPVVN